MKNRRGGRKRVSKTRLNRRIPDKSFIGRAVVRYGLLLPTIAAVYFACEGDAAELKGIVSQTMTLMSFILGHYFRNPKG